MYDVVFVPVVNCLITFSDRSSGMKNGGGDAVSFVKRRELPVLILYAIAFYSVVIHRSLGLSRGNFNRCAVGLILLLFASGDLLFGGGVTDA